MLSQQKKIKIPGASGWYGIENTDEGVILYGEDVEIEGDDERTNWLDRFPSKYQHR